MGVSRNLTALPCGVRPLATKRLEHVARYGMASATADDVSRGTLGVSRAIARCIGMTERGEALEHADVVAAIAVYRDLVLPQAQPSREPREGRTLVDARRGDLEHRGVEGGVDDLGCSARNADTSRATSGTCPCRWRLTLQTGSDASWADVQS